MQGRQGNMIQFRLHAIRDYFAPLFRRPNAVQMAALCYRGGSDGPEILLVQSSAGRWIMPKGWPVKGTDGAGTALTEAWEEAGVKHGKAESSAFGKFRTTKTLDDGPRVPCTTYVYPVEVRALSNDYPEAEDRRRKWVPLSDAADLVGEEGLRDILTRFAKRTAA